MMPFVGLQFSMVKLVPAAGHSHNVNVQPFTASGCSVCADGSFEVLKSLVGDKEYSKSCSTKPMEKQRAILDFFAGLGDLHITHQLLRWSVNASRMNYTVRTAPPEVCDEAAKAFDRAVLETAGAAVG